MIVYPWNVPRNIGISKRERVHKLLEDENLLLCLQAFRRLSDSLCYRVAQGLGKP